MGNCNDSSTHLATCVRASARQFRCSCVSSMSATLERMWAGSDARLRMYPGRERPTATDRVDMEIDDAGATTTTTANTQEPQARFDPLRDHQLDEALQINRVPNPDKADPAPTARADGGGARGRGGRGRGGRGGRGRGSRGGGDGTGRGAARRAQPRYEGDELRPIALVDGLEILGRGDVRDKRLHQPPNGDAQVVEGTLGITSVLAAQMKRSIEYAKRANRPRIICESVDQFSLAAR